MQGSIKKCIKPQWTTDFKSLTKSEYSVQWGACKRKYQENERIFSGSKLQCLNWIYSQIVIKPIYDKEHQWY